jgi:methanogenic corrinoid protein MtbC1
LTVFDDFFLTRKRIDKFINEDSTIRNRYNVLIRRVVIDIIRPNKGSSRSRRNASNNNLICSEQTKTIIEQFECLESIVGSTEKQKFIFVADGMIASALMKTAVTVRYEYLCPIKKQRIDVSLFRKNTLVVKISSLRIVRRAAESGASSFIAIF